MQSSDVEALKELSKPLREANRRRELLVALLGTVKLKDVIYSTTFIRALKSDLQGFEESVREVEDEILKLQRTMRNQRSTRSRTRKRKKAAPQKKRSLDTNTIPGAIRTILAANKGGLLAREIFTQVKAMRPQTMDVHVSAALHPMVKRGEVAREGFHKNYRYLLVKMEKEERT